MQTLRRYDVKNLTFYVIDLVCLISLVINGKVYWCTPMTY